MTLSARRCQPLVGQRNEERHGTKAQPAAPLCRHARSVLLGSSGGGPGAAVLPHRYPLPSPPLTPVWAEVLTRGGCALGRCAGARRYAPTPAAATGSGGTAADAAQLSTTTTVVGSGSAAAGRSDWNRCFGSTETSEGSLSLVYRILLPIEVIIHLSLIYGLFKVVLHVNDRPLFNLSPED